jgi:hypothetical protein
MSRRLRPALAALALSLASCSPPPVNVTGKLCTPQRPCPSGWDCAKGICRATGSGNRVANGDFASGVAGWVTSHGTVVAVADAGRAGPGAARWSPDGKGESVLTLQAPAVDSPAAGTWCAQAWVQGGDGAGVGFDLVDGAEAGDTSSITASGGVWARASAGAASSSQPLSVRLRSSEDAGTRQLFVDDVALWQDTAGDACAAPP